MNGITIRLTQPGGPDSSICASFPYDPDALTAIHAVPGRAWDARNRVWRIPPTPEAVDVLTEHAAALGIRVLAERALSLEIAERRQHVAAGQKIKLLGDGKIEWPCATTPYAHQRASLEFLATLGSGALLHEMGTGKTACAIAYAEWLCRTKLKALLAPRILVICPNSVKRNWGDEIDLNVARQGDGKAPDWFIPEGDLKSRATMIRNSATRYCIVNCEALSLKATADALLGITWDMVIVDESTRFKSPTAKRTKLLLKLRAAHRVILTGSPITGAPQDAWSQFEFIQPGLFGNWWRFSDTYLQRGYFREIIGVKPDMAADLRNRIDSRSYRVLKADVLDLPPKVHERRYVDLEGDQLRAYKQMRDQLFVAVEGMPHASASIILTQLLRLTQITSGLVGEGEHYAWLEDNAKLRELDALLDDELAGEQVVIFANFQRELEALARRYTFVGGVKATGHQAEMEYLDPHAMALPIIYGPTPERIRHEIIQEFQAGKRRLLFAQAHSGGIGINLTAARTAIFYTRTWSAEDYWQAQDRLHRIGQHGTVTIVNLIARNTVDEQIDKALQSKANLADRLTGDDLRKLAREILT